MVHRPALNVLSHSSQGKDKGLESHYLLLKGGTVGGGASAFTLGEKSYPMAFNICYHFRKHIAGR